MIKITTHTIVKNEENWIWYSLMSVKDFVSEMLVFDDSSTDKTWEIIKGIKDSKIKSSTGNFTNAAEIRNSQLTKTETDWFLILDGDEVWNSENLLKLFIFLENCPKDIYGVFTRTRNCVGDVYHYQPESAGRYNLKGMTGNFNIRAFRNLKGFHWGLDYPQETFFDSKDLAIDKQDNHITFVDTFYWHMTFLPRTSVKTVRKYRQIQKVELGKSIKNSVELPEVFFAKRPVNVPSALVKRSTKYFLKASVLTPIKSLKRLVIK